MTDTSQQAEYDEDEDLEELLPDLYVETATNIIYEVKFFDTFVLVRPATPQLYLAIKKLSHVDFVNAFDAFCGDPDAVREFMRNATPDFVVN